MSRWTVLFLVMFAFAVGGGFVDAMHRQSAQYGGNTQEMTKSPPIRPELTCQPIASDGSSAACPGWGKCHGCWPDAANPLPWQVTPAKIDDWAGKAWTPPALK